MARHLVSHHAVTRRAASLHVLIFMTGVISCLLASGKWFRDPSAQVVAEPAPRPAPRHGSAAIYDRSAGRVLVFGGVNHLLRPEVRYGDTWAWDGRRWYEVTRDGPGPRIWPSAAVEPPTRRMLLFGGLGPTGSVLSDTWRLAGSSWTQLQPAPAPAPRWHFAMAADGVTGQVVLFGGIDTAQNPPRVFGDTWVWAGESWRKASDIGPSPRFGHAMAFDPFRGRIVLVGGRAETMQPLGDAWTWSGRRWEPLETHGLPPRVLHGLAFDAVSKALLVFGGWNTEDGNYLGDTCRLEGAEWRQLKVPGPPPLRAHVMVSDPVRRCVVLFGGYTAGAVSGELWEWNGRDWTCRRAPM